MRFRPLVIPWLLCLWFAAPAPSAAREPVKPPARAARASGEKRTTVRKAPAKRAAVAKAPAKKAAVAKAPAKKAAVAKAPAKKAAVAKAPVKKAPAAKAAAVEVSEVKAPVRAPQSSRGRRVARRAASLVGDSLASYRVPDDCSGLVRLAYQYVGVELLSQGTQSGENASSAIYRRAQRAGALHQRTPHPGDVVFFRETYDRNGDGLRNDGVTHVGVIESVAGDGTVVFVHRGGGGVARSRMNLRVKGARSASGQVVNHYLRRAEGDEPARLTRELFVGYGTASRL